MKRSMLLRALVRALACFPFVKLGALIPKPAPPRPTAPAVEEINLLLACWAARTGC